MLSLAETLPIPGLDKKGLLHFLAMQPDIIAVYLFGSAASGKTRPNSDIDLAILLARQQNGGQGDDDVLARFDREMTLTGALESYVSDRSLDVIFLDTTPLLLRFQVLSTGYLLYENPARRAERVEFEVSTVRRYLDMKPFYDFRNQTLLRDIQRGHFGERRQHYQRALDAGETLAAGPSRAIIPS